MEHLTQPSEISNLVTPTHCVFRRGSSWFALPAMVMREALLRPDMVFVPGTPKMFLGLCHVRSEFVPVLNLDAVQSEYGHSSEQIMLILDDVDGPWAILVDEVSSLQTLEISDAPETDVFDIRCTIVGWATSDETVIQILDPSRIRQFAEDELSKIQESPEVLKESFADAAKTSHLTTSHN